MPNPPSPLDVPHSYGPDVVLALDMLAKRWPIGSPVRHPNGWTGQVVDADPYLNDEATPGVFCDGAHTLLWPSSSAWDGGGAVAIAHTVDGIPVVAWYAEHVLRRVKRA